MKIITDRRHCALTEESPRITTIDDNNTLTAVVGLSRIMRLFSLPAFLNGVAGIHLGLTNLNEIKTPVLEFFSGMHRTRFAVLQYLCLFTRTFLPPQAFFQQ